MSMSLDFKDTCPEIDQQMYESKEAIKQCLDEAAFDLCPMFAEANGGKDKNLWLDDALNHVWFKVDACFEELREINVKMREAADYQIEELEERVKELEENENA